MSDITRKETIQILKQLNPKCCIDPYKIGQALEFAINSLEVDEAYQLEYEATTQPSVEDFIRFAEKKFDVKLHITEIKKHQSDFSDLGQEPRKGHWYRQTNDYVDYYECSECGMAMGLYDVKNYCPNCGSRNEVEE